MRTAFDRGILQHVFEDGIELRDLLSLGKDSWIFTRESLQFTEGFPLAVKQLSQDQIRWDQEATWCKLNRTTNRGERLWCDYPPTVSIKNTVIYLV